MKYAANIPLTAFLRAIVNWKLDVTVGALQAIDRTLRRAEWREGLSPPLPACLIFRSYVIQLIGDYF